jgi:hypothetical protein
VHNLNYLRDIFEISQSSEREREIKELRNCGGAPVGEHYISTELRERERNELRNCGAAVHSAELRERGTWLS